MRTSRVQLNHVEQVLPRLIHSQHQRGTLALWFAQVHHDATKQVLFESSYYDAHPLHLLGGHVLPLLKQMLNNRRHTLQLCQELLPRCDLLLHLGTNDRA